MQTNHSHFAKPSCPFDRERVAPLVDPFITHLCALPTKPTAESIIACAERTFSESTVAFPPLKRVAQGEVLAKALFYRATTEHLAQIVTCLKDLRAGFPETCGIAMIQSGNTRSNGQHEVAAVAAKSITNLASTTLSELFDTIAVAQITMCRQLTRLHVQACSNDQASSQELAILDELRQFLNSRRAPSLERMWASGFEAACVVPLELFKVALYLGLEEHGAVEKLTGQQLTAVAEQALQVGHNSIKMVAHLASLNFHTFDAHRRNLSEIRPGIGRIVLNHAKFKLTASFGDPRCALDLAKPPGDVAVRVEDVLRHGCPGRGWIPDFMSWGREILEEIVVPKLPNLARSIRGDIQTARLQVL